MTDPLAVAVEAAALPQILPALASLPMAFRQVASGGDVTVISGSEGWPRRAAAAARRGAVGVLVTDPGPSGELTAVLPDLAGIPVVLDRPWAHSPAVEQAAPHLRELTGRHSLLELREDAPAGTDVDRALLTQLGLLRAAVAPVLGFRAACRDRRGHEVLAELPSGARCAFSLVLSDALEPGAQLRLAEAERSVSVRLPAGQSSLPGECVLDDGDGSTLLPTVWESSSRVALRLLSDCVLAGRLLREAEEFAEDVALTTSRD